MKVKPHGCWWSRGSTLVKMFGMAAVFAGGLSVQPVAAQAQDAPRTTSTGRPTRGFRQTLPIVRDVDPRPQIGPEGLDEMFEATTAEGEIDVVWRQSRMIRLKKDIVGEGVTPVVAVGHPGLLDFELLHGHMLRITGTRVGTTDLSILTHEDKTYVLRVHIVYDMDTLRGQLAQLFPDAVLEIKQLRENLVVSGEARDTVQVRNIIQVITNFLNSMQAAQAGTVSTTGGGAPGGPGGPGGASGTGQRQPGANGPDGAQPPDGAEPPADGQPQGGAVSPLGAGGGRPSTTGQVPLGSVINLIRIPTSQQVLLKVRIAEVQRVALREMGFTFNWGQFTHAPTPGLVIPDMTGFVATTNFNFALDALRQNNLARILAEPNLTTMSGHQASFLSGGEIPIPVPQAGTGGAATITIEYRRFGTTLDFTPYVLDKETIRLTVTPEVSQINFAIGTPIAGGIVPGFSTRRAATTVEMRQGQTLAIAGLLQMSDTANTTRTVLAGDLPYIGALFRNNSSNRQETELLVTVTPYLIEPMNSTQVPRMPGDEINTPNDMEFYMLGRIEGRTGRDFRSTTEWDDPVGMRRIINLEKRKVRGEQGFCD